MEQQCFIMDTGIRSEETSWNKLSTHFSDLPAHKATDWAAGYLPAFEDDLQLDLDDLSKNNGRVLLDHGCGKGEVTNYLKNLGISGITGVDASENMIKAAHSKGNGIEYHLVNAMGSLPFPENYFNGAMSFFVFLTMDNPYMQLAAAREIHRVLYDNTPFAILVNNPEENGRRFSTFQSGDVGVKYNPGDKTKLRLFGLGFDTPFLETFDIMWPTEHYIDLLKEAGFKNIKAERRKLNSRHEPYLKSMGINPDLLHIEKEHHPFVSIVGYK
jgi:SAM-dependent methyltransferase